MAVPRTVARPLTLWENRDWATLRRLVILVCGFTVCFAGGLRAQPALAQSADIRLAPPRITIDSILFYNRAELRLSGGLAGAGFRYAVTGDSATTYRGSVRLDRTARIAAWTVHPEYRASDSIYLTVVRARMRAQPDSVRLLTPAHSRYPGAGGSTLSDFRRGTPDFSKPGAWLGFQADTVRISVHWKEPVRTSRLMLGILSNPDAWILPPGSIAAFHDGEEIGNWEGGELSNPGNAGMTFLEVRMQPGTYGQLELRIAARALPEGHPGHGSLSWIFLDEIIIPD